MDKRIRKKIHYLANQNRAYVNAILKDEGLIHGERNLLVGISQEELDNKIHIDKSAITHAIKSMIKKGYVLKEIDQFDRRYRCLYLTKKQMINQIIYLMFFIKVLIGC